VKPWSYRRTALALALMFCPIWSVPAVVSSVQAQEPIEPPAYRGVVREALAEYHAKNFNEARALFDEAHQLFPNARTLRGLGMTSFELRRYRESISFLEAALASQVKPLDGSLRAETERLLRRAERFVGKLNLTVAPASATLIIDGEPTEFTPGQPLLVEIGDHTLEFRAEGYLQETRTLRIKGRENETWDVLLVAEPAPPPPRVATPVEAARTLDDQTLTEPEPAVADRARGRPLYKNPWLWSGVGAVVLASTVTAIVLATRDPKLGPVGAGDSTPFGGVISALESRP
jgi:tetratricopeptide (TPR) repeat protein